MKVICQGIELSDALSKVVRALPLKRNNPILEGIKLVASGDTLILFATDLELAIEKKINAQVLIEGEMVVPGKLFADYAKKIEEEQVELDGTDSAQLIIKYLDSHLSINCYSADEYPTFKEVATENSVVIMKKSFKEMINRVIFNVATDEARPALRGCFLNIKEEEITSVASDGYRLALAKEAINNNGIKTKIIVPAKSMIELSRLIDDEDETMTLYIENNFIMVDLFHTKIVSRLMNEEYINYEKVIPAEFFSQATVDKKQFENSIERAALISRAEKKSVIKIDVKDDFICISAKSEDGEINEKLTAGIKGKDMLIGLTSKYILDAMHAINEAFVTMKFTSTTGPVILNGETDKWLYMILPLRLI